MHARLPVIATVKGEPRPQSFAEYRERNYFGALDGLRALSIVLVVLHHSPRFQSPWLLTLQENGRHGVSLFFVISGFLICTLLLRERHRTGTIALGSFYGRRAARLFPLYYAVLALHVVAVFGTHLFSAEGRQLFHDKLPSYVFYYSNWLPTSTQGPFFYAWSLAVEEQFYLCFAVLLFLAPSRFVIGIAAAALLLKFAVFQMVGPVDVQSALWRIVFSYQEPILLGVLLGFALHRRAVYERLARWLQSSMATIAVGTVLVAWLTLHPITTQSTWDVQVLFVLMALLVAGCVVRPAPAWLGTGLLAHVGKVSYGIYLLHWLVLVVVSRVVPSGTWFPGVTFMLSLLVSVVAASFVYRFFEAPIIAHFKQRAARKSAAARAVASVTTAVPEVALLLPQPAPVAQRVTVPSGPAG